jgi:hypothetical protein
MLLNSFRYAGASLILVVVQIHSSIQPGADLLEQSLMHMHQGKNFYYYYL